MLKNKIILGSIFFILCTFNLNALIFDSILDLSHELYIDGVENDKTYDKLQKKIIEINSPKDCEKLNKIDSEGFTAFQYIAMTPGTDELFSIALDKYNTYMPYQLYSILNYPINNIYIPEKKFNVEDYVYYKNGEDKKGLLSKLYNTIKKTTNNDETEKECSKGVYTTDITYKYFNIFLYLLYNDEMSGKINLLLSDSRFNNLLDYNTEGEIATSNQTFRIRPLTCAIRKGNKKLFDFLIKKKAEVNYTTEKSLLTIDGKNVCLTNLTTLADTLLAPTINMHMVQSLLDSNANISIGYTYTSEDESYENYSPLFIAIERNDYNLFKTIHLSYSNTATKNLKLVRSSSTEEYTPLHWAINQKKVNDSIIKTLFDKTTSQQIIKKKDGKNYTATELLLAKKNISSYLRNYVYEITAENEFITEKLLDFFEKGIDLNVLENKFPLSINVIVKATKSYGENTFLESFIESLNKGVYRIQIVSFSDGSHYEGEIKNGLRNGLGTHFFNTGAVYTGEWLGDLQSGYGVYIVSSGSFYKGNWTEGKYHGQGYFQNDNISYDGNWYYGSKNGYGTLISSDFLYEGNWLNDEACGEGVAVYRDGSYYVGNWKHNKKNGYGEYYLADGSSYLGEWEEDVPNGEGTIKLLNGDFYYGEIEYGNCSGYGSYHFNNGDIYDGTFVNNEKSGIGIYQYDNGNYYEGEFLNNQQNGKGRLFFKDGNYYEGQFKDGLMSGKGSLFILNEDKSDYTVITSDIWENSEFPSYGSVFFGNGDEYVGELNNGAPSGNGTWTTAEERREGRKFTEKLADFGKNALEVVLTPLYIVNDISSKVGEKIGDGVESLANNIDTENPNFKRVVSFYKRNSESINQAYSIAQWSITAVDVVGTVITFIPQTAAIGANISKAADITDAVLAVTHSTLVSTSLASDINQAKGDGAAEFEIQQLKENYGDTISGDIITAASTLSLGGVHRIVEGHRAKKTLDIYPKLYKSQINIKSIGNFDTVAKSVNIKDSLVKSTVGFTYGKIGKELIKKYGDDAAKLLFKYGDNALYALNVGGDIVLKAIKNGGPEVAQTIFNNSDQVIKLLARNPDNVDDICKLISQKGKMAIDLLEKSGSASGNIAKQYAKYGDDFFNIIKDLGPEYEPILSNLINKYPDDAYDILLTVQKNDPKNFQKAVKYIDAYGDEGLKDLKSWNGKMPDKLSISDISLEKYRRLSKIYAENQEFKRMEPEIIIKFKCSDKYSIEEFDRQLAGQENGLNNQTIVENIINRKAYEINGRDSINGGKAQREARERIKTDKITEYREQGMNRSEAEKAAKEFMSTKASLHDPDQIAGGDPLKVTGLGDSNINSSIGSQWKNGKKVNILADSINEYAKGKSLDELSTTKLNVKLVREE